VGANAHGLFVCRALAGRERCWTNALAVRFDFSQCWIGARLTDALDEKRQAMPTSLFEAERVRLAPPDPDHDAEVESAWTHDSEYLRLLDSAPARPLSPAQVKKKYEALEKERDKQFYFAVRTRDPEGPGRLLGFVQVKGIDWLHGSAELRMGIGAPADRGQGFGSEAARLMLNYAFDELGLHRLGAVTYEYNPGAIRFIERHGFSLEVRMRQAVQRDFQRWDALHYGLLRPEWEQHRAAHSAVEGS
jgi:RimJ/RimL family protein N-acetyltransferase